MGLLENLAGVLPVPNARDIAAVPDAIPEDLRKHLITNRENVQELAGLHGDKNNAAVRWKDLIAKGYSYPDFKPAIGSVPGPPGAPGATGPSGTITPDPTPPPTVTGLAATAGLTSIIVTWNVATYTQGHGPRQTNIYAVKKAAADPTLPTFPGAAGLVEAAPHALNIIDIGSDTSIRWHIWAKFVTNDGYESASPAGGTNGVVAQTGLVGTSDLGAAIVLAANLAPNSVTADKANLDIGGENLCANNSFEVDANADGLADGWTAYNNTPIPEPSTMSLVAGRIAGVAQRHAWTGANTSTKGVYADAVRGGAWQPNTGYVLSWYARRASAGIGGMAAVWNNAPASSVTLKNPVLNANWQRYAYRITWGAVVETLGRVFITISAAETGYVEIDDVQIEQGDTLSGYFGKLALNTIVAGDGAIGNLAILNAQIGQLAVDDQKVSNLSASKLSVGTGIIGGDLKSSNYVFGVSGWIVRPSGYAEFDATTIRGQLVAAQIDTRGLSIKDAAGNIILAAGNALDFNTRFSIGTTGVPQNYANRGDVGGYANSDPLLQAPLEWTISSVMGAAPVHSPNFAGGNGLQAAWDKNAGGTAFIFSSPFAVSPFKTYIVESSVYNAGTSDIHYLAVAFYDAAGAILDGTTYPTGWPAAGAYHYYGIFGTNGGTGAKRYSTKFGALATPKIPANAVTARVGILGDYANFGQRWLWGGAQVREVVDGQTLAIDASNISTYIANLAVGTAQIALLAVDTAQIAALAVTNAKIGGAIQSTAYVAGVSGWSIDKAGSAEFNVGTFRGALAAASGSFAGSLTAATGSFAGNLTAAALTVAGAGIFLPVFASSQSTFTAVNGTWTDLLTTSSINPGSTGTVATVITIEYKVGVAGAVGETDTSNYIAPSFRIVRGSTVIFTWTPQIGSVPVSRPVTSIGWLDTPGAAAAYKIQMIDNGGAASYLAQAFNRTLTVLGVNR